MYVDRIRRRSLVRIREGKIYPQKDKREKLHDLKNRAFPLESWRLILQVGNSSWNPTLKKIDIDIFGFLKKFYS
jgi:hypothetical protein